MDEAFDETKNVPAEMSAETFENKLEARPQPIDTRRADALIRVAEGYLAGSENERASGDRYLIHVHTDHWNGLRGGRYRIDHSSPYAANTLHST